MAPRVKRRRCRNCPDEQLQAAPDTTKPITRPVDSDELWKCGLYACSTLIGLLDGFVSLDLPGDVLAQLKKLHARLGTIVTVREQRHVDSSAQQ